MLLWTIAGIIAQCAMVFAGHVNPSARALSGPLGMLISLVVGTLSVSHRTSLGAAAQAGVVAGGLGALIGIVLAFGLHDVPAFLILAGTAASAAAGAVGAVIRNAMLRKQAAT
jgi:hypothetical protein